VIFIVEVSGEGVVGTIEVSLDDVVICSVVESDVDVVGTSDIGTVVDSDDDPGVVETIQNGQLAISGREHSPVWILYSLPKGHGLSSATPTSLQYRYFVQSGGYGLVLPSSTIVQVGIGGQMGIVVVGTVVVVLGGVVVLVMVVDVGDVVVVVIIQNGQSASSGVVQYSSVGLKYLPSGQDLSL
jgi:hypothetical protein